MGKCVFINPSGNQTGMCSPEKLSDLFLFFKNDMCVEEVDMITNEEIQYVNNIS